MQEWAGERQKGREEKKVLEMDNLGYLILSVNYFKAMLLLLALLSF